MQQSDLVSAQSGLVHSWQTRTSRFVAELLSFGCLCGAACACLPHGCPPACLLVPVPVSAPRAKYIVGSVAELLDKPGGGRDWLLGLRDRPYAEAHEALCSLPGRGPVR
jgi:hypothetical protein